MSKNTANTSLSEIAKSHGIDLEALEDIVLASLVKKGLLPESHKDKNTQIFVLSNGSTKLIGEVLGFDEETGYYTLKNVHEISIHPDMSGETHTTFLYIPEWIASELTDFDGVLQIHVKDIITTVPASKLVTETYYRMVAKIKEIMAKGFDEDELGEDAKASDAPNVASNPSFPYLKNYNQGIKDKIKGLKGKKILVSPGSKKKH